MTIGSTGTKRRTLLQRGVALLAGGAALAGTTRWAGAASPPAASPPSTLTLYARTRPVAGHHHADGRIVASGDLLDAPDGTRIGTFHANCFCLPTPFGPQAPAASNLEFHVLQLENGTLFSIGSGLDAGAERALAIVGGTDRYAGRSGSYVQRAVASRPIGDDVRQIIITFAG
jgi:hypothetical protein